MRNTLITIAAWTAAIAITLWQRLLWPAIKTFLPGIEDFFSPVQTTPVQTARELPAEPVETYVIEISDPLPVTPTPKRTTRKKPARLATGFAS